MHDVTSKIDGFFKSDFNRKFIICISIPFISSLIYLTDILLLPEFNTTEQISHISAITVTQRDAFGYSSSQRKVGYNYSTTNNFKFSTLKKYLRAPEVTMTISPMFNIVKTVESQHKKVKIESGFNGINKFLLIFSNAIILISLCYTFIAKEIAENACLNLIYFNIIMFLLWGYLIIKF